MERQTTFSKNTKKPYGGGQGGFDQRGKKPYHNKNGDGGEQMKLGTEFKKQPYGRREEEIVDPFGRQQADELKKKLLEESKKVIENARGSKNEA